jgi:hypothetical protein
MKTSLLICARREPTLLPRVVRLLYWQTVFPDLLCCETVGEDSVRIRLVLECDPWRLRRLTGDLAKIIGVELVATSSLSGMEPRLAEAPLAPAAR